MPFSISSARFHPSFNPRPHNADLPALLQGRCHRVKPRVRAPCAHQMPRHSAHSFRAGMSFPCNRNVCRNGRTSRAKPWNPDGAPAPRPMQLSYRSDRFSSIIVLSFATCCLYALILPKLHLG